MLATNELGRRKTRRTARLQSEHQDQGPPHWLSRLPSELIPLVLAQIVLTKDAEFISTARLVSRDWEERISELLPVCSVSSQNRLSIAVRRFPGLEAMKLRRCYGGKLEAAMETLLKKLPNLQALELQDYDFFWRPEVLLGKLSTVAGISRLEELRLVGDNRVKACIVGTQLPHLQALHIISRSRYNWDNQQQQVVTEFSTLPRLQNLRHLTLQEVAFDLAPLQYLKGLQELDLWSRAYSGGELTFLEPLANLSTLGLAGFPGVTTLDPLWKLTALCTLRVMGLRCLEVAPDFSPLSKLRTLQLNRLTGRVVQGVEQLTRLEKLSLVHMDPSNFSKPLTTLTSLRHLEAVSIAYDQALGEFIPLSQLSHLTYLHTNLSCELHDSSSAPQLPFLSTVVIPATDFEKWVSVQGMSALTRLQRVILRGEGSGKDVLMRRLAAVLSPRLKAYESKGAAQCLTAFGVQCNCNAVRQWVCNWEDPDAFFPRQRVQRPRWWGP